MRIRILCMLGLWCVASGCTLVPNPALEDGSTSAEASSFGEGSTTMVTTVSVEDSTSMATTASVNENTTTTMMTTSSGDDSTTGVASSSTGPVVDPPPAPVLLLAHSPVKRFDFSWADVPEADAYQLLESPTAGDPFLQLGADVAGGEVSLSLEMPLHGRWMASYMLQACNTGGCTDSAQVSVMSSLAEAVGYVKASNTGANDVFGTSVALSGDSNTLAVGAYWEDSNSTTINSGQGDETASNAGAVYVFVRDGVGTWSQQAYVKASNTGEGDYFGWNVALSGDGDTLAVGAYWEDSNSTTINAGQGDDTASDAGAAYVFVRDGMGMWTQQAYVKPTNTGVGDLFGAALALSGDGSTLAVGAPFEDGSFTDSGAAYVFVRDGMGIWSQEMYLKANAEDADDRFGESLALSSDGDTLAVGAYQEDSSSSAINIGMADNSADDAGAAYVFVRDGMGSWSQQA
ncbi:MAG: FG-GAP repeat protein, partial [Myxococcales bacterium]|nr:FG-GAP repeat protein [Myxococcales bacterium]